MNTILLSGGSGKRLWPLSNDVRSKQFIKLFKNDEEYNKFLNKICDESMFKVKNKPTSSDKIMTLTTCSYEFKNARTVVICKEIDN